MCILDAPLVMDANYRFTPPDRRYIDNQIRALQRAVCDIEACAAIEQLTSSASVARVKRYPVADGHVLTLRAIVTVRSTANSGAVLGEWEIKAAYKRVSGTLSTAYAPVITNLFIVGLPVGPTLTLNGNTDVDLNVTGVAATNLTWEISEFSL